MEGARNSTRGLCAWDSCGLVGSLSRGRTNTEAEVGSTVRVVGAHVGAVLVLLLTGSVLLNLVSLSYAGFVLVDHDDPVYLSTIVSSQLRSWR